LKENVGDLYEKGKDKAKDALQGAKRTFEGISSDLQPLYQQGWDKLEMFFKHGKFEMEDWRDLLGSKFEEFKDMMKPGREKEGDNKGKRRTDNILPDKLREFYDLMWNKIEDVFKNGHINLDELRQVFGDNADDLKKSISKFVDKNLNLDKTTTDSIDEEIRRIKGLVLSWKDKLCDNCEHKKNLWESLKDVFRDLGFKASNKWSNLKEKVTPGYREEPVQPQATNEKSTEL